MDFIIGIFEIRIIIAAIMLIVASILDIWKREIHDVLWIGFGAVAIVLLFFEPDLNDALFGIGISMIAAPIVIILWRFGLFGGADAFAIIVLAGLTPQITLSGNLVTPLTVLTNAILLSVVILIVNAIRNLVAVLRHQDIFNGFDEPTSKKIFAVFIGYRAKNPKYSFSIEKNVDGKKKLEFTIHHAENAEFCTTSDTWITPGVPYMIYIAIGFAAQIFYGDLMFNFFQTFT